MIISISRLIIVPILNSLLSPAVAEEDLLTNGFGHFSILRERRIAACCVDGSGGDILADLSCSLGKHHPPYAPVETHRHWQGASSMEFGCWKDSQSARSQGLHFPGDLPPIISSAQWQKIVFLTDPLTRLYFAWRRLCGPERERPMGAQEHCIKIFGRENVPFHIAVQSLWKTLAAGGVARAPLIGNNSIVIGGLRGPTAGGIQAGEDPWR